MVTLTIIASALGVILTFAGFFMLNKNFKPILAFFIILVGIVIIIATICDPLALYPKQFLKQLGI